MIAALVGQIGDIVVRPDQLPTLRLTPPGDWLAAHCEVITLINRVITRDEIRDLDRIAQLVKQKSFREITVVQYSESVLRLLAAGRAIS